MDRPAAVSDLPDDRLYEFARERRTRRESARDEPVSEVEVRVAESLDVETERAIGEPDDLGVLPKLVVESYPHSKALHLGVEGFLGGSLRTPGAIGLRAGEVIAPPLPLLTSQDTVFART